MVQLARAVDGNYNLLVFHLDGFKLITNLKVFKLESQTSEIQNYDVATILLFFPPGTVIYPGFRTMEIKFYVRNVEFVGGRWQVASVKIEHCRWCVDR